MYDAKNARLKLFLTNPEPDKVEGFDRAIESCSPFKTNTCPVVDIAGNPLIIDSIYLYTKHSASVRLKVRRWEFGAGNILDRYYRVFYTDANLQDSFLIVEAQYPKGICGGAVYQSQLVLVTDTNNLV